MAQRVTTKHREMPRKTFRVQSSALFQRSCFHFVKAVSNLGSSVRREISDRAFISTWFLSRPWGRKKRSERAKIVVDWEARRTTTTTWGGKFTKQIKKKWRTICSVEAKNLTAKDNVAIGTELLIAVATVHQHTNTQGNLCVFSSKKKKKANVSVF